MKSLFPLVAVVAFAGCGQSSAPNRTTDTYKPATPESANSSRKDNTAVNQRDRSSDAKTPIDQNENQKDVDITANIRQRVVKSDLSTNAQNSKIMTQDGKVTLRGPVKSEHEKKKIEDIALEVAGPGNVDNQLEVQP